MKMASNQKMQENELALKVNFTQECRWPVLIFSNFIPLDQIHRALIHTLLLDTQGHTQYIFFHYIHMYTHSFRSVHMYNYTLSFTLCNVSSSKINVIGLVFQRHSLCVWIEQEV